MVGAIVNRRTAAGHKRILLRRPGRPRVTSDVAGSYQEQICRADLPVEPGWEECRDQARPARSCCPAQLVAAGGRAEDTFDLKEWPVEWGGRTRDPAIAPDGKVWFVGQAGNYIANLDPKTGAQKRYEIEEGTNPHTLIVDQNGIVWYAGNRNGRIGRLDPATGGIKTIMTGEAKDPHTLVFDGKGHIWFTSQGSNRVGRLNMATEKVDLDHAVRHAVEPVRHRHRLKGTIWVALLRVGMVAKIDPQTMAVTRFKEGADTSRSRRLDVLARRHHLVRRRGARHARPDQSGDRRSEGVAGARRRRRPAPTRSPRTTRTASGSPKPDRRSGSSASTRRPRSSSRTSR